MKRPGRDARAALESISKSIALGETVAVGAVVAWRAPIRCAGRRVRIDTERCAIRGEYAAIPERAHGACVLLAVVDAGMETPAAAAELPFRTCPATAEATAPVVSARTGWAVWRAALAVFEADRALAAATAGPGPAIQDGFGAASILLAIAA